MARLASIAFFIAAFAVVPAVAVASWGGAGTGQSYSKAQAMPAGNTPTAVVTGRNVTVTWAASSGATPVSGYTVKRFNNSGTQQTIGAGCAGVVAGTSCTENDVPAGTWRYSVTPVRGAWQGTESAQSTAITVAAPSMTLSSTSVTNPPQTLSGTIASFKTGQAVIYRLDNATTGTILGGSITPSPVPSTGTSTVSVIIPVGTTRGAHTVYAIGSAGDTASRAITVKTSSTLTTAAWDIGDASGGGALADQTDPFAVVDGRRDTSSNLTATFAATRYLEFDMNNPLATGRTVTGMAFNLDYTAPQASDTVCVWFEARRKSTGAVISTHGSATTPLDCVTGTTLDALSTPLPAVTTSDLANDLAIRLYARSSGSRPIVIDRATVSGNAADAFTLYRDTMIDSSSGTPVTDPWSNGGSYLSVSNWTTAFATTRYLTWEPPAYVPTAATVTSASFTHSFRSATAGTSCMYFAVYSGATLIGTYGSSTTPIGCSSSTTVNTTTTTPIPAVNTPARANTVSIRVYVRNSSSAQTRHENASLSVVYAD